MTLVKKGFIWCFMYLCSFYETTENIKILQKLTTWEINLNSEKTQKHITKTHNESKKKTFIIV